MAGETAAELQDRSEVGTDPLDESVEASVVMPCLNEAATLERCIVKARKAMAVSYTHLTLPTTPYV